MLQGMITPDEAAHARAFDFATRIDKVFAIYSERFECSVKKYPVEESYVLDSANTWVDLADIDRVVIGACRRLERELEKAGWRCSVELRTWHRTVVVKVTR